MSEGKLEEGARQFLNDTVFFFKDRQGGVVPAGVAAFARLELLKAAVMADGMVGATHHEIAVAIKKQAES